MSGKPSAARDPTDKAWARVWRGIANQVHLIAPVALLIVVGLALNVLPFPLNYLVSSGIFGGALYAVVPRFFATNEPTEAETRATLEDAEKLRAKLLKEEEQREAAESNKARKRRSKQLAKLSKEDKDKRRKLEKKRKEAAAARRAKRDAADADGDDDDVPISFGRPAAVSTESERDAQSSLLDGDDDEDEALFAARKLVGPRLRQQGNRR